MTIALAPLPRGARSPADTALAAVAALWVGMVLVGPWVFVCYLAYL